MRYTLRQIEYFIAVAETGSITSASRRLSISQPSISTAVTALEEELETQLFIRHHAKGLVLTQAGRTLLLSAKQLRDHAEHLYDVATESTAAVRGQLSLGCFSTLAPMIMPELSHSFTNAFPSTRIHHVVCNHEDILAKLQRAEIDVAVGYDLLIPESVSFTPLAKLPPHVLLAESHFLARRPSVSLAELAAEPLLLLDLPISSDYFLGLFAVAGVEPRVEARLSHQDVIRTMVANGYGYTIANVRPRAGVAMDGRPLVRVPLSGDQKPMVIGAITLQMERLPRVVEAFVAHCESLISDSYIPGMMPSFG